MDTVRGVDRVKTSLKLKCVSRSWACFVISRGAVAVIVSYECGKGTDGLLMEWQREPWNLYEWLLLFFLLSILLSVWNTRLWHAVTVTASHS